MRRECRSRLAVLGAVLLLPLGAVSTSAAPATADRMLRWFLEQPENRRILAADLTNEEKMRRLRALPKNREKFGDDRICIEMMALSISDWRAMTSNLTNSLRARVGPTRYAGGMKNMRHPGGIMLKAILPLIALAGSFVAPVYAQDVEEAPVEAPAPEAPAPFAQVENSDASPEVEEQSAQDSGQDIGVDRPTSLGGAGISSGGGSFGKFMPIKSKLSASGSPFQADAAGPRSSRASESCDIKNLDVPLHPPGPAETNAGTYANMNLRWIIPRKGCIAVKFTTGKTGGYYFATEEDPIAPAAPTFLNISRNPGDFDYSNLDKMNGCASAAPLSALIEFEVVGTPSSARSDRSCRLAAGQTYYINMRNEQPELRGGARGEDSCDVTMAVRRPEYRAAHGACGGVYQLHAWYEHR